MKILHFADLHIRLKDDNRYRNDLLQTIRYVLGIVREQKPDYVVISGDLFDNKHPTMSEFALATAFLKGILAQPKVVLVAGNHDEPNNEVAHSTLQPIANLKIPGMFIFGEPGIYNTGDADFLALPYIYQDREGCMTTLKKLHDEYTGNNLFFVGHLWVTGYANKIYPSTEFLVSAEYLNSLHKVKHGFLGHIHLAGEAAPRMYYSGSPFRINWGENEPIKVMYMWTDGKLEAYQMPAMPMYTCDYTNIPADLTAASMVKIMAHGLPLDQLMELENAKKKLEALGHAVKIDLELKGIKMDVLNPEKKELGFAEFFEEYIKKQDLTADRDALFVICTKIIDGQLTKDSSPFDLFPEAKK